jgi:hypothetical protein
MELLREHLDLCAECAARFRGYESVCAAQSTAANELEAFPVRFKGITVPAAPASPTWGQVWRWALPTAGMGFAVAVLLLASKPTIRETAPPGNLPQSAAVSGGPTAGSLARYRSALAQSGDRSLESMLSQDADIFLSAPSKIELQQLQREVF